MFSAVSFKARKWLFLSLAIISAALGLLGLAALGFDVPILRQIVLFVFLTFLPGFLILKIFKMRDIGVIETVVYSVGLSIALVMLAGLLANFILPLVGVTKPISLLPMAVMFAILTGILGILAYIRDKGFTDQRSNLRISEVFSLWYLLLLALPLLAILGAHLVNTYQNNLLLLFFIIIVACVVALVAFDKLPQKAYPLAIVMIALSLLLHVTLISDQLIGSDIHREYYFANLVVNNNYWDFTISHLYNTALSVVLLCPIFSLLLNMDTIWVLKILYPFIFSLVPLTLFHLFREQIGDKKAFLATFFFMAMPMFVGMTAGVRNQIAQLFFALLILLMIDRKLTLNKKASLFVIFSLSLIVSHYALGYIFLAFLVGSWIILALMRSRASAIWEWLIKKFGGLPREVISGRAFPAKIVAVIVVIYLIFMLGWYGAIAQGTAFTTIRLIGQRQYTLLSTELPKIIESDEPAPGGRSASNPRQIESDEPAPGDRSASNPRQTGNRFFKPEEREALVGTALGLDFTSASPSGKGFRIFQYLTELFIVAGFLAMILRPKGFKFKAEYIALSIVAALILLACIVLPRFSVYLHVPRFYHITLFLLAPLLIVGGETIWQGARRLSKFASSRQKGRRNLILQHNRSSTESAPLRFVALAIIIPYFLFTSGFLSEITNNELYPGNDIPHSWALSSYKLDMPVFGQKEVDAAAWLAQNVDDDTPIYADWFGRLLLNEHLYYQDTDIELIPANGEVPEEAFVFLRKWNVEKHQIHIETRDGAQRIYKHVNLSDMPMLFENRKVIHDNGSAKILGPGGMKSRY